MSSRGRKFKPQRGGGKQFTPARELYTQDSAEQQHRQQPESEESSDDEESDVEVDNDNKIKSVAQIETSNPNRAKPTNLKASDLSIDSAPREISRREREGMEKERAKNAYWKAHVEGKTDQARSDMARLAIVRKQRDDAAKKRAEEAEGKKGASASKVDSLNAGKSIIKKRLG